MAMCCSLVVLVHERLHPSMPNKFMHATCEDARAGAIALGFSMSKFKHFGVIVLHGNEYQWHVRHWGGASNAYENHRGLSVSVCLDPGRKKALLVEFAFKDYFFDAPRQQTEFEQRLRSAIDIAIDAGWRPLARGKPFVFRVLEEEPNKLIAADRGEKRRSG